MLFYRRRQAVGDFGGVCDMKVVDSQQPLLRTPDDSPISDRTVELSRTRSLCLASYRTSQSSFWEQLHRVKDRLPQSVIHVFGRQ